MSKILKSIEELVAETPKVDNQATFDELWKITTELFEKVKNRFELTMDPCSADLQPYHGKDGASGYMAAYSGPEIDWLIHSWTGNPKATFTNMHLTVTLGSHIDAPNLGFALGTTPDLFMYMDYLPRVDLQADPDYVEKYYNGKPNDAYIEMMNDSRFSPFVTRHTYTRVSLTPVAKCFGAKDTAENMAKVREIAHAHVDTWLEMVEKASAVPQDQRAALSARDHKVRQTICDGDPANIVAEMLFGKELTDRLIKTLHSGTRTLPVPK
jgi:hypothetical protein